MISRIYKTGDRQWNSVRFPTLQYKVQVTFPHFILTVSASHHFHYLQQNIINAKKSLIQHCNKPGCASKKLSIEFVRQRLEALFQLLDYVSVTVLKNEGLSALSSTWVDRSHRRDKLFPAIIKYSQTSAFSKCLNTLFLFSPHPHFIVDVTSDLFVAVMFSWRNKKNISTFWLTYLRLFY